MTKEEILRKHFAKPSKIGREFQNTYDAMEEYAQSLLSEKWISVEERLPDVYKDDEGEDYCHYVLATNGEYTYKDSCQYRPETNDWHMSGDYLTSTVEVTHWQPLPSPPTK